MKILNLTCCGGSCGYASVFLFIFLFSGAVYAQPIHFTTEYISKLKGLSSTEITGIVQDKKGIIWISTRDGLNRYDGYTIKVYQNIPSDSTSLCDNIITTLFLDSRGDLWLGTESNGVSRYDRQKDRFINYHYKPEDPTTLSYNYITAIAEDHDGKIWIGTMMGLNLFIPETQTFRRFLRNQIIHVDSTVFKLLKKISKNKLMTDTMASFVGHDVKASVLLSSCSPKLTQRLMKEISKVSHIENSGSTIKALASDNEGFLWLGLGGRALLQLNTRDFQMTEGADLCANGKILSLCWADHKLWIGTVDNGINILDNVTGERYSVPNNLGLKLVKCIVKDSDGEVWAGSDKGLLHYNKHARSFEHPAFLKSNDELLSEDVSAIFQDSQHNFWIACYQRGLHLFRKSKAFNEYVFQSDVQPENVCKTVSSVLEDADGNIWVGFFAGGVEMIKRDGTRRYYSPVPQKKTGLGVGTVHCIFQDSRSMLWVGTYEGGLQRFDKEENRFINVDFDGGPNKIKDVRDIIEDKEGNIWFAVHGDGIKRLDVHTNNVVNFRANYVEWETCLSNDWVLTLHCDARGRIFVGSVSGISIFDPATKEFKSYGNSNSNLSHNRVQVIAEDETGHIWLGTQNGLDLFVENKKAFRVFHSSDGLPNNCINGIQEDHAGNLWISTNNGLCKFRNGVSTNYHDCDGLSTNEFFVHASFHGNNDKMMFGTKNGLTFFFPSEIRQNTFKPAVVLTEFKVFNKPVPISDDEHGILTKSISETNRIVLPYDQNMVSFEFAAINYIVPERNSYAYVMEGLENKWNYVGNKREATYTYLSPGRYTFKVKASNNDGIWNNEPLSVEVIVTPPWWYSPSAIVVYVAIVVLLLLLARKVFLEHMKEKGRVEMNEMKLRFFAGISHEFRTPLTLLLGPLHQLSLHFKGYGKEQRELFSIAKRNGQRLLKLTNQLMNIYEFDAGCMRLLVREEDIVEFTKRITDEFQNTARKRNMYYHFISNTQKVSCWFDADKVEKILVNIISNAFKYTNDGGSIVVYFSLLEGEHLELVPKHLRRNEKFTRFAKITVDDSGKGIASAFKDRIFDRFFRIEDAESRQEGTGLGLFLARQLAGIHHGDISVTSEIGKGSKFTILLPINADAFAIHEIATGSDQRQTSEGAWLEESNEADIDETTTDKNRPVMLLVEDNADVRQYLRLNFKSDFSIQEAVNGAEGLQKALALNPDIIISDIMMPVMDGIELCSKLKKNALTNQIPIILLTARIEEDFQIEGLQKSSADDYITKPFNIEILSAKVRNHLQYRDAIRKKIHRDLTAQPSAIQEEPSADTLFARRAVEVVEQNLHNFDFDVTMLGRELGVSQTNLYRKLQAQFGISGVQLIRDIRLKRAAQLIKSNHLSIAEVSYRVGFNDPKYFSKTFKKFFGVLPSEYVQVAAEKNS